MFVLLSLLTVCLFSASDVSAASTDNQSSYQTAFLYFLPDYQPKEQDEAEVRGCVKLGYTVTRSNCAAPRILKDKCPVGNSYKTCYCAGSPTCTGSTSSSNPYPSSTGASSTNCTNCPGDKLYTWTCSASSCSAYTLSSCPSHGYCSQCCSGKYKLNSCTSGYHVSGNYCEEDCGPSSYNWCPVHHSCHTNCCTDGTIQPCDPQCGGSGCEPACTPLSSETGCSYGTYSCSDGCSGTRTCCSAPPVTPADPCAGVTCSDGKTCSNGSCVCPSGQCCPACTGGQTCSNGTCVTADPCAGVTCPSGQSCSNGECISTCVSGGSSSCSGQTSACSSSQVQTSSCKDCGGVTHYSCRAKTCSEQGKKDCNGSCIATSECCGGCSSTQKCSNGTCVNKTCEEQGKKTCNGSCIATSECCGGCSSGYTCSNGTCVNPCANETCPTAVNLKYCTKYSTATNCCTSVCTEGHECNSSSDCPSYSPVCTDGFCRCRSGYYLNGGGYCCPNSVPSGTLTSDCYY